MAFSTLEEDNVFFVLLTSLIAFCRVCLIATKLPSKLFAMAEPVAETRPVDEAAPVSEAIAEETSNTEVAGEVEAEAEENDDAAAPAEADLESEVDDDIKSKKVTLADLSAKGTALYAHKKYEGAADIFSRASILQAEINGETAPENAEILFHYGRSLFKVGQSKSDVLGGSAPAEKKTKANGGASSKKAAKQDEEKAATTTAAEGKENKGDEKSDVPEGKKLFFQFTGDENFDDESDEDEVGNMPAFCVRCLITHRLKQSRASKRETKTRKKMTTLPLPLRFSISLASATTSSWRS